MTLETPSQNPHIPSTSSQDTVFVCGRRVLPVFCTDIISCNASAGLRAKVRDAHLTDERVEAQGADVTYPSLRPGIQKRPSPTIPRWVRRLSALEGSNPKVWISCLVGRIRGQIRLQHPGKEREFWDHTLAPWLN